MKLLDLIKDRYNREARLAPALLVMLPVVVALLVWFPGLRTSGAALLTLLASSGGIVLLTNLGRDRGKAAEMRLFESWGGKPSVALLRHRDTEIPRLQKARYHAFLSQAIGMPFPTAAQEAADPIGADDVYEAAVSWLMAKTRDTKNFSLLFEENVNYGFRRNLWALKPAALSIGAVTLVASVGAVIFSYISGAHPPGSELIGAMALLVLYLFVFVTVIKSDWVKVPSKGYARRLLEACDALPQQNP